VDGQDATEGTWLVIPPNSDLELERFIRNRNIERGNRFKFIERTGEVEAHRGVGAEDGLIRVEYKRELVVHEEETIIRRRVIDEYDPWYRPYVPPPRPWCGPLYRGPMASSGIRGSASGPTRSMNSGPRASAGRPAPASARRASIPGMDSARPEQSRGFVGEATASMDCSLDTGITVAGSESNQQFFNVPYFETEAQSEVIVLKLRGEIAGKKVATPVTVDRKPQCVTCGKTNKGDAQFCSKCGTALLII
jgi:hypothetical protein